VAKTLALDGHVSRTRQIIAYAIGDRSEKTCRLLWERIPASYQSCQSFSDLWEAYQLVFPAETHHCVGKAERQTNHIDGTTNSDNRALALFEKLYPFFYRTNKVKTSHKVHSR